MAIGQQASDHWKGDPMSGKMALTLMAVLGGLGGYAYYHYVGCLSGTCPLTSNAWIMTGYGAFAGVTFAPFVTRRNRER